MNGELWVLDASAFVKLIRPEAESTELRRKAHGFTNHANFEARGILTT